MPVLSLDLTQSRREIMKQLMERPWFKASRESVKLELAGLPEDHDGFLKDLASRPDTMGGITVLELIKIARGNFALIPIFRVKNEQGEEYTYEYVSWRQGPTSGAKGVVFVRDGEVITHFIVLKGDKFAVGGLAWDTIGGFADLDTESVRTVLDRFKVEICEELGLPDIKVDEVIDFGPNRVDAGMTNNAPRLFVAFIDGSEAERISENPVNPDVWELKAGPVIVPISQLSEMVKENTDGFFRSIIALAAAHGIISFVAPSSASIQ